jgi:hypothetical protein
MPAALRNAITELFFRIHPWIYRKTGGRILGRFGGTPVLLLTTRGRKSGEPRTNRKGRTGRLGQPAEVVE